MSSTRRKGDTALAKFTDNPERIGKDKPRKKNKNMTDTGTPDTNQQPDTGDKNQTPDPEENNDDKQNQDLMDEIYVTVRSRMFMVFLQTNGFRRCAGLFSSIVTLKGGLSHCLPSSSGPCRVY